MKSHDCRPIVYLGATFGGVVLVMGLAFLVAHLAYSGHALTRHDREIVRGIYVVGGLAALGTGFWINALLKRHFRHYFGTYLDDPDAPEEAPVPATRKVCLHCGAAFPAYRNDLHAAGFCSPGCREHYPGK